MKVFSNISRFFGLLSVSNTQYKRKRQYREMAWFTIVLLFHSIMFVTKSWFVKNIIISSHFTITVLPAAVTIMGSVLPIILVLQDFFGNFYIHVRLLSFIGHCDKILRIITVKANISLRRAIQSELCILAFITLLSLSYLLLAAMDYASVIFYILAVPQSILPLLNGFRLINLELIVINRFGYLNEAVRNLSPSSEIRFWNRVSEWSQDIGNLAKLGPTRSFDDAIRAGRVRELRRVYESLSSCVNMLMSAYDTYILVTLAILLLTVMQVALILTGAGPIEIPFRFAVISSVIGLLFSSAQLLSLVVPAHLLRRKESALIRRVSHQLLEAPLFSALHHELQAFLMQLSVSKVDFNVCGVFELDMRLIVGFVTTLTTYSVVLATFK